MKSITKHAALHTTELKFPCLMQCKNGGAVALFTSQKDKYLQGVIVGHPKDKSSVHTLGMELTHSTLTHWFPFNGQIRLSNN